MNKFPLRNTILDLILRIEQDNGYSHLLIQQALNKQKFSVKDEALLTEIVYGTIERKLTLEYYLSAFIKSTKKLEKWVYALLKMSVFQMEFLDKVPSYAIIHEAVEIGKQRGHKGVAAFINGVLRNVQRNGVPNLAEITNPVERLAIQTSHPKWLVEHWVNEYGFATTQAMCNENLKRKPISIRIQPLKINRTEAIEQLEQSGFVVEASKLSEQGIIIFKGNIIKHDLFNNGYLTIQDQSSMLVGELINVKPGMKVLDTCSAPGGKVTHIAEKMENHGEIFAHDLHKGKLQLIKEKAKTLSLTNIHISQKDARKLNEIYAPESFDRILVDAPCSGLGVVRGKPDIKYSKQAADIKRLAEIQLDILSSIANLLKQDGLLIYSTCTVERLENELVVQAFLQRYPSYQVDKNFFQEIPALLKESIGVSEWGLQLFPQSFQTDGFFLTRLKKS